MDVVIATRNPHKFRELTTLLKVRGVRWRSLAEFPQAPSVEERGRTFDANAAAKALTVARITGCAALADDSGLEVDALQGRPGVRSARFAGRHGDDRANNEKLLQGLRHVPASQRRARYRCSLALALPANGSRGSRVAALTRGLWQGRIAERARGRGGFGYDPLFLVPRLGKTVGELPASVKARLSHRARAALHMRARLAVMARSMGRAG